MEDENNFKMFSYKSVRIVSGCVEYFNCIMKERVGSFDAGAKVSRIRFVPYSGVLAFFDDTEDKMDYGKPDEMIKVL
jgi:hypothetical protein